MLFFSQSLTAEMKSPHRNDSQGAFAGVVSAKRGLEDIETGVALATNCMVGIQCISSVTLSVC